VNLQQMNLHYNKIKISDPTNNYTNTRCIFMVELREKLQVRPP
jgi:hypothetical protein